MSKLSFSIPSSCGFCPFLVGYFDFFFFFFFCFGVISGTRKAAEQLAALAVLAEEQVSFPGTHNHVALHFQDIQPLY
jgi:hypothetical protein